MKKNFRIVTGGTGFIGSHLVTQWLNAGKEVAVVGRFREKIREVHGDRVRAILWEELDEFPLEDIARCELIVHLAGENIADGRWTSARKKAIESSRVETTQYLARCASKWSAVCPPIFSASGIGIYGSQALTERHLPKALDESTPIDGTTREFLPNVAFAWELAMKEASDAGIRVVFMRLGAVLGKGGGVLQQLSLPFHLYLGGPIGTGLQPFSWVAIDDVVRAIEFLLAHPDIAGPVNLVAPGCVQQREFAAALGKILRKPSVVPTPAAVVRLALGELAEELILNGQNVIPQRLSSAGFTFEYPDLADALRHIFPDVPPVG